MTLFVCKKASAAPLGAPRASLRLFRRATPSFLSEPSPLGTFSSSSRCCSTVFVALNTRRRSSISRARPRSATAASVSAISAAVLARIASTCGHAARAAAAHEVGHVLLAGVLQHARVVARAQLGQHRDVPSEVLHQDALQRAHHAQVQQVHFQELLHAVLDVQQKEVRDAEQLGDGGAAVARARARRRGARGPPPRGAARS